MMFLVVGALATPATAQEKTGWGISGGVGASLIKDKDGNETFNGNSFGYSLEVEYRFTPYFALAVGPFSLGSADDFFDGVDTTIKVRGFGFAGRVIYPVSDTADVYARLGGVSYFADLEPGGNNGLFGDDAVEVGAGVDLGAGNSMSFRFEGRYFNGSRDESGALITAGFSYRF
jgi:hypothetical protein